MASHEPQYVNSNGEVIPLESIASSGHYITTDHNGIINSVAVMPSSSCDLQQQQQQYVTAGGYTTTQMSYLPSTSVYSSTTGSLSVNETGSHAGQGVIDASQVLSVAIDRAQVLQGTQSMLQDSSVLQVENIPETVSTVIQQNVSEGHVLSGDLIHNNQHIQGQITPNSQMFQDGSILIHNSELVNSNQFSSGYKSVMAGSSICQPSKSSELQVISTTNAIHSQNYLSKSVPNQHRYQSSLQPMIVNQNNQPVQQESLQSSSILVDDNGQVRYDVSNNYDINYGTRPNQAYTLDTHTNNETPMDISSQVTSFKQNDHVPVSRYIIQIGKRPAPPSTPGVEIRQDGHIVIRASSSRIDSSDKRPKPSDETHVPMVDTNDYASIIDNSIKSNRMMIMKEIGLSAETIQRSVENVKEKALQSTSSYGTATTTASPYKTHQQPKELQPVNKVYECTNCSSKFLRSFSLR